MQSWKVQLFSYLSSAWQYRWYGIAAAWIICLAGWIGVGVIPDQYQSEAKVYIDTDTLLRPLLKGLAVSNDADQQVSVMLRTLITRPNIEQVIRLTDPHAAQLTPADMQDKISAIQKDVSLRSLGAKNLFGVAYTNRDPAYAQAVTQSLVSILVDSNVGDQRRDVEGVQSFISERVAEYERLLRETEKRRAAFKAANLEYFSGGSTDSRLDKAKQDLASAQADLDAATTRRNSILAQLRGTQAVINVAAPTPIILNSNAGGRGTALAEAEARLDDLRSRFTDSYPDVVATQKLVDRLKAEAAKNTSSVMDGNHQGISNPVYVALRAKLSDEETNVALSQHRVSQAQEALESTKRMMEKAIAVERQYADIDRDYEVLHKQYEELLQRRESARLSQAIGDQQSSMVFRIVEPPQQPDHPIAPNRLLFNSIVLLIGLGGGAAVAFLLGLNAERFVVSDQLRAAFDIPVIGVISNVRHAADAEQMRKAVVAVSGAVALLLVGYVAILLIFQSAVTPATGVAL
ncbi:MAG TPA: XrtA system polysaccharide chain length determinant [Rhizomicrobium sp.]|nr:XrtA system polysaccharide chain length determinant [Rhizomicrobium sp.]